MRRCTASTSRAVDWTPPPYAITLGGAVTAHRRWPGGASTSAWHRSPPAVAAPLRGARWAPAATGPAGRAPLPAPVAHLGRRGDGGRVLAVLAVDLVVVGVVLGDRVLDAHFRSRLLPGVMIEGRAGAITGGPGPRLSGTGRRGGPAARRAPASG